MGDGYEQGAVSAGRLTCSCEQRNDESCLRHHSDSGGSCRNRLRRGVPFHGNYAGLLAANFAFRALGRRDLVAGTESVTQERSQRAVGQEKRRRDHSEARCDAKSRRKPSLR